MEDPLSDQQAAKSVLQSWLIKATQDWEAHWSNRPDHRYGKDFAAFIGERLLTDFELRRSPGLQAAEIKASDNTTHERIFSGKPCQTNSQSNP